MHITVKLLIINSQSMRQRLEPHRLISKRLQLQTSTKRMKGNNERRQRYQKLKRNDDQNYSATPHDSSCRGNLVTVDN